MINGIKKTMEDAGDKLEDAEKTAIEAAIADVEEAVKGDDAEEINNKVNTLMEASHKLAEQMYAGAEGAAGAEEAAPEDDNVVDAEFEEVKDEDDSKKA